MKYNTDEFSQVMMHKDVYEAYVELVEYYRYINRKGEKRGVIKHLLIETFENKLRDLKADYQVSVCRTSKSGRKLTHQQTKCINELNKKFQINEWDDEVIYTNIFKHDSFVEVIKNSFKIVGRDAITNRKKEILDLIGFKQVREGNQWFITHKNYIPIENNSENTIKIAGENKFRVHRIYDAIQRGELDEQTATSHLNNTTQKKYLDFLVAGGVKQ